MGYLKPLSALVILFFTMNASATYVGGNPMSYTDPTGLVFESTIAKNFTPKEQQAIGAAAIVAGGVLVRLGIGLGWTGSGFVPGGLGAYLLYEGGLNGAKGLQRELSQQLNEFGELNPGASMLLRSPASIPPRNFICPVNH